MTKIHISGTNWFKVYSDGMAIMITRQPYDVYVGLYYGGNVYEVDSTLDIKSAARCMDIYRHYIAVYEDMKKEEAWKLKGGMPCTVANYDEDKIEASLLSLMRLGLDKGYIK